MPKTRRHNHIYDVLSAAISALEQYPEHSALVKRLQYEQSLLKPPRWTEDAIIDAMETFIQQYGRVPTTDDLKHNRNLPTHASIKLRFDMTAAEWLNMQYPNRKSTYSERKQLYTEQFIQEYQSINPSGPKDFENRRNKQQCRGWQQVAKYNGCTSWRQLLAALNLQINQQNVTIQVYTDLQRKKLGR